MEFYLGKDIFNGLDFSFNSQRDGILPNFMLYKPRLNLVFQFPTGWNSTDKVQSEPPCKAVSIPNGMEFYTIESP